MIQITLSLSRGREGSILRVPIPSTHHPTWYPGDTGSWYLGVWYLGMGSWAWREHPVLARPQHYVPPYTCVHGMPNPIACRLRDSVETTSLLGGSTR